MWTWIFKVALVSFLFIFLLHYLYSFFKTTLTSPKIKDLVNKPMRRYDSIYDSLQSSQGYGYIEDLEDVNTNMSKILNSNPLTTQNPVKQNMKDELKKYLSELSGSGSGSGSGSAININDTNVTNDTINNSNSYAPSLNASVVPAGSAGPDFSMSNMSSSSFSSSYSEF
jgi:hypothetical protein